MKDKKRERYLVISDLHIPDHDIKTLDLVLKFISIYQPDYLDILGDFINFSKISKFQDPYHDSDLVDEIEEGRGVLRNLVNTARKANNSVEIAYYQGNHEFRNEKFLSNNAPQIATLKTDDEYVVSIPHLFELRKLGVKWYSQDRIIQRHGVSFTHGHTVRMKSGFTAHANIDRYGSSGFSGHTHRLCLVTRTQSGNSKFWIETGCLCNLNPSYVVSPDWTQGFAIAEYDFSTHQFYPQIIPIINHSFMYEGKLFS